jgi:hypothetical protein
MAWFPGWLLQAVGQSTGSYTVCPFVSSIFQLLSKTYEEIPVLSNKDIITTQ